VGSAAGRTLQCGGSGSGASRSRSRSLRASRRGSRGKEWAQRRRSAGPPKGPLRGPAERCACAADASVDDD